MAEIELRDFIPKEVIEAPLKLEKNMSQMIGTLDEIITKSKQQASALEKAHSTTEIKKMVDALTKEQAELKKVNQELLNQVAALKAGHAAQQKQIDQLNELEGALGDVSGGLGGAIARTKELTKAALVFIATPLGLVIAAIGAALFALMAYFKGSEEGQNRLNRIVRVGQAIFEQFMNVVEDVGEAIFNAIENPQQALKDFGQLLKDQIVNRFMGMLEFIPAIGTAIELVFKGKFKEASTVAFDAMIKVGLGVENATQKIDNFVQKTNEMVEAGIKAGDRIAKLEEDYDKASRALIVKRAETERRVQEIRNEAAAFEGEQRKAALLEAIRLERELGNEEVRVAQINLALQKEFVKAHGDDKDALDAVAEATAKVADARAAQYRATVRFAREIGTIDEQMRASTLKQLERINKIVEKEVDASNELIKIKDIEIQTKKGFEDKFESDMLNRNERLLEAEEDAVNKRKRLRNQEIRELQEESMAMLDQIANVYGYFTDVIGGILDSLTGSRIEQIEREQSAVEESYNKQIELAGENVERRSRLENELAEKQAALERKKNEQKRKTAVFEKLTNIAAAIQNTARWVIEFGIVTPLAIAAGIAGAIQVGIIAGTKIPSYAKGTKRHGGGPARVGEEGSELLFLPDRTELSPDGPAIMDLPPGTAVLSHKESMRFLALAGLSQRSARGKKDITGELGRYFQELNYTIKNKKETHWNISPYGVERIFRRGESREYFVKNVYR